MGSIPIIGLKDFLRARGLSTTGVKKDLLRLAKLYFSYPVLRLPDGTGPNAANAANASGGVGGSSNWNTAAAGAGGSDQDAAGATASSVFDNSSLGWKQVEGHISIPRSSLLRR